MAPTIPPREIKPSPHAGPASDGLRESNPQPGSQHQPRKRNFAGAEDDISLVSSKKLKHTISLPVLKPARKTRIGLYGRSQALASASGLSRLPVELAEMVLDFLDVNPIQLMTLLGDRNSDGSLSNVSLVSGDNNYWASFAPQNEKNEANPEGYHAKKFIERYQAMSATNRKVLETLWTGTNEEKNEIVNKMIELPLASAWDSYDIMRAAVSQKGSVLRYADENLKADKDIVLAAVSQNGSALYYADKKLKSDFDIVLAAVSQDGLLLTYANENLKSDRDIVLAAVSQNSWALYYADKKLKSDFDIVLAAVSQDGSLLIYANENLKSDRDIVLAAVKQKCGALTFASEDLKRDPELRVLARWPPLPER